ncbi:MAG: DUF3854 domain-containing protein [Drouetiella hepatica Uher 2000/2452]|jgi:hypothetical protein|uniref:DUF3854 domain-containing protein n=1 Tax=Drouetiella hepatica Uher 2000/2452 TaxID=904376 RepID=A0A951UQU0_9CYAN|nr:DUF3854 domain-containing protein [Drouetiella hepatica Uher 2000/2452]
MDHRKYLYPSTSASRFAPAVEPPDSLEAFSLKIEQEFTQGSGIAPELFQAAVHLCQDLETTATGDVETPIHEALNWHYTRFGQRSRELLQAALLLNEDNSCWQAKLSRPLMDSIKGKARKYEAPKGKGSRTFLPPVPPTIRQRIADRYGVEVPMTGSFWDWLAAHPEIQIIITEGGKKALSLLSLGYVAIALYGVNGGYRKGVDGTRTLIADLERFALPDRSLCLAFDQDAAATTRHRVNVALFRFSALLKAQGCAVTIATWDGQQGKGVDDLIVNQGAEAWAQFYQAALSVEHWQIWQRLEGRLTYPAHLRLNAQDLSQLQWTDLPQTGILAIASGKGTGKTKLIAQTIQGQEKVLAAGHRVALMRNLSARLRLEYRGDLDKVKGQFITNAGYTLRMGFCVDALLAINPAQFAGCVLVLDEVVQVLRHLLTSSTCAQDGKRPALLARLRQIIAVAKQVIIADADLDNASIHYIQALRGEDHDVFLIRNDYQAEGYAARLIDCADRSAIVADLVDHMGTVAPGQLPFVVTDSKAMSKAIARLLLKQCPDLRVLLINSETSSGELERSFMQSPDVVLEQEEYDVIICSPSVATGVSIEAQGKISRVYGLFTGVSSTDADMAQALGRVREPVERVIWCAKAGSNFSKVSRSTNALELKRHLQDLTSTTISLVRSSLREDIAGAIVSYDWQSDPHVNLYAGISAAQNFSMYHLREALQVRLRYEGHQVRLVEQQSHPVMKLLLRQTTQENRELDAEAIVSAADLTFAEVLVLENKESTSPAEQLAISKFYLKEFYGLEGLTVEDVLWDREGRRRAEILNLEAQLFPQMAIERTVKPIEKQAQWQQGYCLWDLAPVELRRRLRQMLGFEGLIEQLQGGWEWTKHDLAGYAAKARALASEIKLALNFTISDRVSDVQIVHQLLLQLGLRVRFCRWSRSAAGHLGEKLRVYKLDESHWQVVSEILERRRLKREVLRAASDEGLERTSEAGSPRFIAHVNQGGDPTEQFPENGMGRGDWLTDAALADVRQMWDLSETLEERDWVRANVPTEVLKRAIA